MSENLAATDTPPNAPITDGQVQAPVGKRRRAIADVRWSAYSGILIFAVVIVVFSIWVPSVFLTTSNWQSIAQSQAITAILAMGLLFPLSAGVFDLSAAQCLGLTGLVCSWLMTSGPKVAFPVAIGLALAVGLLVGLLNGFLVAIVGLDSFIATLGTTSLLLAGGELVANGKYFGSFPSGFNSLTSGKLIGVPIVAVYVVILGLIFWYLLEHTPLGRRINATGANRDAARLAGIRTKRLIFCSLVASSLVAAIAGVLYASTIGTTNQNDGPPYLLPAFTAAFLGATQIKPGVFNVWGTFIAVYLLGTGVDGLQLVGGKLWITDVFNGAALIIAVSSALIGDRLRGGNVVSRLFKRRPTPPATMESPTSLGAEATPGAITP